MLELKLNFIANPVWKYELHIATESEKKLPGSLQARIVADLWGDVQIVSA
jgi:hypothetical protein